ncbi:hypothetical protein TSUD_78240 [Trifolium subterraneum]|uniref:Uncharacterized protein n=1 Tax=Trifolium subterraneum TaxID=3900 RepID=A0A2Z6LN98_TRISU|nr:hypothetical protein TSUD_78240 [Trifolium subterraneum]
MTCSQEAELRGLTAPWPTIATNLTGGSSVVTGESMVVDEDDELRQKGEVNEIEDGEEKDKGKRLVER